MKLGIIQLRIEENVERNIQKVNDLTSNYNDTIFLLPELFTTGFNYDLIKMLDESHIKLLDSLNKNNIFMGSIVRKKDSSYYNSFFVKYKNGIYFIYDKTNLFPLMGEDKYFSPGNGYYTFEINNITAGCAICFDLRFCEIFFRLRKNGAKIVFLPAEWPKKRIEHLKILSKARAIENQYYFIVSNAVGNTWSENFGGNSMIIDPWGNVLKTAADREDIAIVDEIDFNLVDEVRNTIPMRC
ncbi:nitrilase-related carbon-nitrogen hydrolase [Deferribacter abyssi]|uniref:nitrilase-related carbon-nitrogen hydrolase n=1 Tax=Deferribacter abyssi TaxID=213806 RepID=UPI003C27A08D